MLIEKYLIAGGNSTALASDCPVSERKEAVNGLLKTVEQVGFISRGEMPELEMMGGEFCMNAVIAFASTIEGSGLIKTSGLNTPIQFSNSTEGTTLKLKLDFQREGNVVLFPGIGFNIVDTEDYVTPTISALQDLCSKFKLPAFGEVHVSKNRINPYVYVLETNSLVNETACGSGSIAVAITNGLEEVVQPTGESLWVEINQDVSITGKVTKLV